MIVALVNEATDLAHNDALKILGALQIQLNRDFCPRWNLELVEVDLYKAGQRIPPGSWPLYLTDVITEAGDLGYHAAEFSAPYGEIELKVIFENNGGVLTGPNCVAQAVSHEALEMLANPRLREFVAYSGGSSIPKEVCDPVQGAGYDIEGLTMSNFVLPAWFDARGKGPFDFKGELTKPFEIGPSGYLMVIAPDGSSSPIFGSKAPPKWWLNRRGRKTRLAEIDPDATPRERSIIQ